MKKITAFAREFGAKLELRRNLIVKKNNRYFLVDEKLKPFALDNFYFAGIYLGKVKKSKFFPSFELLRIIAEEGKANQITITERAEWLFICGRDIFGKNILKVKGSTKRGVHTLVMSKHGDCLGFGRILHDLKDGVAGVAVKNVSDIGDFLRRERQRR
ncbi:hypothetical protein KEJ15_03675 [Candidatus Bathyarchaeota archaeon]|nr:hypothetical protein [Candidatus Bathyarchaeota archaeon]